MFEIGNTVSLKSGGPLMTVESVNDGGTVTCIWFQDDTKRSDNFKVETIIADDGMPPMPLIG